MLNDRETPALPAPAGIGHNIGGRPTRKRKVKPKSGSYKPHWRMFRAWCELPAWQALEPAARVVYAELELRFNGVSNNGRIGAAVRDLAKATGLHPNTVARGLRETVAKGFVRIARQGVFSVGARHGRAQMVALTRCGADYDAQRGINVGKPTEDFLAWQPGCDFDVPKAPRQQARANGKRPAKN